MLAPELETPIIPPSELHGVQLCLLETIIQGSALSATLTALCRIIEQRAAGAARAAIMITDRDGRHLYTAAAPSLPQSYIRAVDGIAIAADVGTCSAAAARGSVVITRDLAVDPGWARLAHLPLSLGLRAAWSMPIVANDGAVLGTFGTYFNEVREPTACERQWVAALVRVAKLAIERQRADIAVYVGAQHDRFLAELATATQPLVEPAAIMATTARLLAEHLHADRCAYAEIEDEHTLVITGDYSRDAYSIVGRWPMADFGKECARCLLAGQPYFINDAEHDMRLREQDLPAFPATHTQALICVPLHKAGRLTAALSVHQAHVRGWDPGEIKLVERVVARCWEAVERLRITRALHESEAKSRARLDYAVRLSGVGFWYCDLPFDELLWDERVKQHFFFPPEARVSIEDFYARLHPEDRESTRAAIDASTAEHRAYDTVYRTVDPATGACKWIRALGGATYDAQGTAIRFDGVTVDVTAQKQDQERLARMLEAERAQAKLLEQVAAIGLEMHAATTAERVLEVITRRARELLGAQQVVALFEPGGTVAPLRVSAGVDAGPEAGALAIPLLERTGRTVGRVQLQGAARGSFSAMDEALLLQLVQIAAVALDNAQLYDVLREHDRHKDEFLATLAHELRNPLAPIRTGLEILNLAVSPQQSRKARQMMQRQVQQLARMVDELLDVSRVRLGKITLRREPVDFNDILASALETVQPLIADGAHQLSVHTPKVPCVLRADAARLEQVMGNLLANAVKYTPAGGRIDVRVQLESDVLVVQVCDSGVGIPPDMLTKVFELFTQVDHSLDRSRGGLGLGLSLVRNIVALHGGSVSAASEGLGKGSTFTVRLPLES